MDVRRTPDPADERMMTTDSMAEDRQTERRWSMDASDVLSLLAGVFYLVIGIIAFINLGFDDFPAEATTLVAGLEHTHIWAIVSVVLGLLFLGAAGSWGRGLTTFAGALSLVIGIVVVAARDEFDPVLATNDAYGWVAIAIGAVVLLAAIAVPTVEHHRRDRMVGRRHDRAIHA